MTRTEGAKWRGERRRGKEEEEEKMVCYFIMFWNCGPEVRHGFTLLMLVQH